MSSPLDILHKPIVLSVDADAKYSAWGENVMFLTEEECPVSWTREQIEQFSILAIFSLFSFIKF